MSSRRNAGTPPPHHPDRGTCATTGKVLLLAHEADRLALYLRRRRGHDRLMGYPCRSCGWHHVGHTWRLRQ